MNLFFFVDAILPKKVRVLRLSLLNYSLGHELILLSERNSLAFLSEEDFDRLPINEQVFAVMRAVLICSTSYEEFSKKKQRWLRLWNWIIFREDFLEAAKQFRDYRAAGSTYPRPPTRDADQIANGKEDEGRQLGGDLMPRLINFLCHRATALGYKSVYEIPYGFALHLYFTDLEMEGRIKIENERERQVKNELAEHMDAIRKEREAACLL